MSDGVLKMSEDAESAWRLGGWGVLCELVRAGTLESGWYACPACGGSGTAGTGDPEESLENYLCAGCEGDGHRRVGRSWVNRPATGAWAKS